MSKLLVVIDYQNDFVCGTLGFENAVKLAPGIIEKVEQTLAEDNYVIFTRDTHDEDYLSTREGVFLPLPHCLQNTEGHQLYGALHRYEKKHVPHTLIINKVNFGSPQLPQYAIDLCGSIPDTIELCGVVTNICVLANSIILHSAFPQSEIVVLQNLCSSNDPEKEKNALKAMRDIGITLKM